jgi:uncharacterized membrane protein YoaK (UPF0700 family)
VAASGEQRVKSAPLAVVRGEEWRACTLALIAGYADAYGFIHYQAYVSFMSGNTTQSGISLGQAGWWLAVPTMVAIASFVAGVFVGTLLAYSSSGQSPRTRFGLVASIMAVIIAATIREWLPVDLGIVLLSFAMGIMNTTLSQVGGEAVALGYVSGTLNALARHLALAWRRLPLADAQGPWDTHRRRALLLTGVWTAFLAGAALSTVATGRLGVWVLALPIAVLAAFAITGQPAESGVRENG